jgi:pimeloyl-ACP methyl ester carboxylesterase
MIFLGPPNSRPTLNDPRWEKIIVENDGFKIVTHQNWVKGNAPLVLFIHGWQSGSSRFENRMSLFMERGCHTIIFDLRSHGETENTPEWTAGKIISDVKAIMSTLDQDKITSVSMYGHSLGGFVCIGLHNKKHDGWWMNNFGTLILESPMVAYSPVFLESISMISFMEPILKRWALNGFNKIHQDSLSWDDIDFPQWGFPKCPTLLLQAANDNRLGRFHWDLLNSSEMNLNSHLLETLSHSVNEIHTERDDLIIEWINNNIN